MFLRSLLRLDLSGKLTSIKKRYRNSFHFFDSENIICTITEIKKPNYFYFSAYSYSDDPNIGGFDMSPILWFYESKKFPTKVEAFAMMEQEIRKATKKHSNTRFYREKLKPPKDKPIYEFCLNGTWHDAGMLPSLKRCRACKSPIPEEEDFCGKCGDLPL